MTTATASYDTKSFPRPAPSGDYCPVGLINDERRLERRAQEPMLDRMLAASGRPAAVLIAVLPFTCGDACARSPALHELTLTEAARQICAGSLSSQQLVAAGLARIRAGAALNAFVTVDEQGAQAAAREADAARKPGHCKPLDGIPIVVKDNIYARNLPVTAGTSALKGFVADADAPVVARLRSAGAIVLGKTNMHELAFGLTGYNPAFTSGPEIGVRNAYDFSRVAGGSSSGSASALGARMALAALGTDTSGSLRVPCAFNGCVTLRPTVGRYPQQGIVPLSHSRDTAGPMALTVADVALLDEVIAGGDPVAAAEPGRMRLGIVAAYYADLDDDTRAVTDMALAKLRAAGVRLVNVEMPRLMELTAEVSFPMLFYEAYDDIGSYLAAYRPGLAIGDVAREIASPDVKQGFVELVIPRKVPTDHGSVDGAASYDKAMRLVRPELRRLFRDTFARYGIDAVLFPTVVRVAPAARPESSSLDMARQLIRNIDPSSNAGIPGLQIPAGIGARSGLPVGIEIDGPEGSDRRLLSLGLAIEAILGRIPAPPQ